MAAPLLLVSFPRPRLKPNPNPNKPYLESTPENGLVQPHKHLVDAALTLLLCKPLKNLVANRKERDGQVRNKRDPYATNKETPHLHVRDRRSAMISEVQW